eukprot:Nk52_evm24s265 gene=Nk52_evmTU24s265
MSEAVYLSNIICSSKDTAGILTKDKWAAPAKNTADDVPVKFSSRVADDLSLLDISCNSLNTSLDKYDVDRSTIQSRSLPSSPKTLARPFEAKSTTLGLPGSISSAVNSPVKESEIKNREIAVDSKPEKGPKLCKALFSSDQKVGENSCEESFTIHRSKKHAKETAKSKLLQSPHSNEKLFNPNASPQRARKLPPSPLRKGRSIETGKALRPHGERPCENVAVERRSFDLKSRMMDIFDLGGQEKQGSIESAPTKTKTHADMARERDAYKKKCRDVSALNESLKGEIEILQSQLDSKGEAICILKKELIASKQGERSFAEQLTQSETTCNSLSEKVRRCEKMIQDSQRNLLEMEERNHSIQCENCDLQDKLTFVKSRAAELQSKLSVKSTESEGLNHQNSSLRSEIDDLKNRQTLWDKERIELHGVIESLKLQAEMGQKVKGEYTLKMKSNEVELRNALEAKDGAIKQRDSLVDEISEMSDKIDKLVEQRNFFKRKAESISRDMQKILKDSSIEQLESFPKMDEENQNLRAQVLSLRMSLKDALVSCDAYKHAFQEQLSRNTCVDGLKSVFAWKNDMKTLATKFAEQIAEKEEALAHKKVATRMLAKKLSILEEENASMRDQMSRLAVPPNNTNETVCRSTPLSKAA